MKTKYQLRHLVLPDYVYKDSRLNWTSARVYGFIHSYTNPFFFSNEQLAAMFGCHPDTISTAIGQLEKFNYIKTEHRPKAGGGEVRLSVDTHPGEAKSPSRLKNSEPTAGRNHPGKVVKVNIIKGEIFSSGEGTPDKIAEKLLIQQQKHLRKTASFSYGNAPRNTPPPPPDLTPLDNQQLWDVAWELKLPLPIVKAKYKQVMMWADEGKLRDGLAFTLKSWLNRDITDGKCWTIEDSWPDMEELKSQHPKVKDAEDAYVEKLKKEGVL
jgi:hypothetical protein